MMKWWSKLHIHLLTYILILVTLLSGLFKYFVLILSIVLIHEIGHILVALLFNREITSLTIMPVGGLVKMDSLLSSDIFEDLLISIGGILAQLVLSLIIFILFKLDFVGINLFHTFNMYNSLIISFNLLPICPLDGYKMIKLLEELFIPYKYTFYISLMLSFFVMCMIDFNIIRENMFVFLFLIMFNISELKNIKYVLNRFYLERMNHEFNFRKRVYIHSINHMFKNRNNIINGIDERDYLLHKYFVNGK